MTEKLTTAQLMARFMAKAGIGHIFGYPGDPNLDFIEAARGQGIEFILTRREGTAAFMADACGQLTGLPGVCLRRSPARSRGEAALPGNACSCCRSRTARSTPPR